MSLVNTFQSPFGFQNNTFPQLANPALPSGDLLKKVSGPESASHLRMNPNSRDVAFDANEDIFYIVTTDASGTPSVSAFSFTPYQPEQPKQVQYVTVEEFNKFKEEVKKINGQQFVRADTTADYVE